MMTASLVALCLVVTDGTAPFSYIAVVASTTGYILQRVK